LYWGERWARSLDKPNLVFVPPRVKQILVRPIIFVWNNQDETIFWNNGLLTSSHPETRTSPQKPIWRHYFERLSRENWKRYQFTYLSLIEIKDRIKWITRNIFKFRSLWTTVVCVYKDTLYKDNMAEIWPKPTLFDFGPSLNKDNMAKNS
jgi:hypothetical protein